MNDLADISIDEPAVNQPTKSIFEASNFFEKHKTNPKESNSNNYDCNLNRKFKPIYITLLSGQKTSLKLFDSENTDVNIKISLLLINNNFFFFNLDCFIASNSTQYIG